MRPRRTKEHHPEVAESLCLSHEDIDAAREVWTTGVSRSFRPSNGSHSLHSRLHSGPCKIREPLQCSVFRFCDTMPRIMLSQVPLRGMDLDSPLATVEARYSRRIYHPINTLIQVGAIDVRCANEIIRTRKAIESVITRVTLI